jgi:uncharacterized protein (TIGR02001 family)
MNSKITQTAGLGAAALAAVLLAGTALADGMPKRGSIKAPEPEQRRCTLSANVGLTTDYVFRGISQTAETPTVQGGFDATCGPFYAGVWASGLTSDGAATVEMDWYAGPAEDRCDHMDFELSTTLIPPVGSLICLTEVKAGASGDVWKDGTAGVTVFYSPEYTANTGAVWTIEGAFSQALPKVGMFSPTFSALIGYQSGGNSYEAVFGDSSYTYWNAGVTLGFHEKWSLDIRYWDTSLSEGTTACGSGSLFSCDERVVATLKFTY